MLEYLERRIQEIPLRYNRKARTIGADMRIVRGTRGVKWAVMGTHSGAQHEGTRDQCDTREGVHKWVDALMDRVEAEIEWRYT